MGILRLASTFHHVRLYAVTTHLIHDFTVIQPCVLPFAAWCRPSAPETPLHHGLMSHIALESEHVRWHHFRECAKLWNWHSLWMPKHRNWKVCCFCCVKFVGDNAVALDWDASALLLTHLSRRQRCLPVARR